jgi:hypothetical protein
MLEQQTSDGEPRLQQHIPLHVDKEVPMNQNLSYLTYILTILGYPGIPVSSIFIQTLM